MSAMVGQFPPHHFRQAQKAVAVAHGGSARKYRRAVQLHAQTNAPILLTSLRQSSRITALGTMMLRRGRRYL